MYYAMYVHVLHAVIDLPGASFQSIRRYYRYCLFYGHSDNAASQVRICHL